MVYSYKVAKLILKEIQFFYNNHEFQEKALSSCTVSGVDTFFTVGFLLLQCSSDHVQHPGDLRVSVATLPVESSSLLHHSIYL